jgi:hypothetical protein
MGCALEHLCHYKDKGEDTPNRNVTGEVTGPSLPNQIKMYIHAMDVHFYAGHLYPKLHHQQGRLIDCFLGILKGYCLPTFRGLVKHPM